MSVTDDATPVDGRRADARPSIMLHASQSFVPSQSCHEDGYLYLSSCVSLYTLRNR